MSNQTDIFISYRRDGGDMAAMYIYQALKDRGYDVFYDVEVLRSGKFNEALREYIGSCKDFILVLSPHALDRCEDETDWVRQEIAEAIRQDKNIIPVMMNGFKFPEKLPEEIASVRHHTGLTSSTEYFQESMNRLCEKFLTSKPRKKKNWLILAAAALLAVLGAVAFLVRSASAPVPAPDPSPSAVASSAPEEIPAAEEDDAHVLRCAVPVLPESMENISIMSDDWLFSMPYTGDWSLDYVNGLDLDARIEEDQFYISRFPRQEGTTEYKAVRYGTEYRILLECTKPDTLPEDAVLLDAKGENLNEETVTVKAGAPIGLSCHFVPESWTFLGEPQILEIWMEEGEPEFETQCEGTAGTLTVSTPGEYKIGVKVNSGTVVAYRFFYLTVEP